MIKKVAFKGTVEYKEYSLLQTTRVTLLNEQDKFISYIEGEREIKDNNTLHIDYNEIQECLDMSIKDYISKKDEIEEVWNNSNLNEVLDPYDYITHISDSPWGITFHTMKSDGRGFIKTYHYLDDPDYIYVSDLHVEKCMRNKGIGSKLLEIHLNKAKCLKAKYSLLWVRKNTWMEDWYKRLGYKYYKEYENEENSIWMKKEIL